MKIVQINTVAVNGSTGRIAEDIGKCAIDAGFESYIAYGRRNPSASCNNLLRIGNNWDVLNHTVQTRLFDRQGLASKNATDEFIKSLKILAPDLIHLHNLHGNYINYELLFNFLTVSKIPIVWTMHDCWPITGHCVHFTAAHCEKWRSGCFNCPRIKSYPKSFAFDRSRLNYISKRKSFCSLNNLTIVTVSKWLAGVVNNSFLKNYPIEVIHNGVDIEKFYPRISAVEGMRKKLGIENKFVILGVATGWSRENGLYDFIELRKLLDDKFAIVLVGVSEKIKSRLPKGIIGINRTDSQDQLAEIYTSADIFINGSFEETFGLVTAEAMACGKPVIVYDSTACPEIVTENTGYVVPVQDINSIKEIIHIEAGKSAEYRNERAMICSEYVRNNLDKRKKYQSYINLYNQLLSTK